MLIIAIPKSASTSLLHTMGQIHDLEKQQDFESVKENTIPQNFRLLGKYHSDCRELTIKNVEKWTVPSHFYKQHIPPTKTNSRLLHRFKKVILLRDPGEIILAYRRAEKRGLHEMRTEFEECATEKEWLDRAKEIGLYDNLTEFYEGWETLPTDKLLIKFEDLISNETKVLKAISGYFDLSIDDSKLRNLKLKKSRYSRHSYIQKYVHRIINRFKKFISSH